MTTAVPTYTGFNRPAPGDAPKPFKPQEFVDCAALVLVPTSKQVTKFGGRDRLEMVADLYVFDDPEDIEDGVPSETIKMVVTWGRIAGTLSRAMIEGRPVAGRVGQDELNVKWGTRPWTLLPLAAEDEGKLMKWLSNRA